MRNHQQPSDRVKDGNTTFPMTSAGEEGGHINPSPSGEVEKAIEDHWINCMALAIRACNPAVNGDEIRAGLDKADAELRAFITTYAEDNERLRETVETLQFGERMHNERAEAAQAEIERLRAERDEAVKLEREQCAYTAETVSGFGDPWTIETIAASIRARGPEDERDNVLVTREGWEKFKASQAQAEEMRKALKPFAEMPISDESPGTHPDYDMDELILAARTALMKGGE